MKYYVFSDIHSFYTLFREKLEQAGYFTDPEPHKLLILGDLFDRGKEPREMQKFVLESLKRDEVILVKGNHEDLFQELIYEDGGYPRDHHKHNGTYDTALALTGMKRREAFEDRDEFCTRAAATPYNRTIIPAIRDYYETENYVFVHGWVPCGENEQTWDYAYMEDWRDADEEIWKEARWINGMRAAQTAKVPGKTVVCGHYRTSFGHSVLGARAPKAAPTRISAPTSGMGYRH